MKDGFTAQLHASIHAIPAQPWNVLPGTENPFVSHGFLSALEDSGSVGAATGWLPQHLAIMDTQGTLLGAAPLYAKTHSWGEYVFDHSWAEAFARAGGAYYPKLQLAAPFSPVTGPRLLRREGVTPAVFAATLEQVAERLDVSSVHATFCTEGEARSLAEAGWLMRTGIQFHWHNAGYADFNAFLAALNSNHRKSIRRERRDANSAGLTFRTLHGTEITEAQWDAFYEFYCANVEDKYGTPYLTRRFFSLLSENLGDKVVLMLAEESGVPVAGALNLRDGDTLYGRNWGIREGCAFPFLHFELCYYRALDYAIAHGLKRVEAGAQGHHKLQRGYLPARTFSAHYIRHPGLRAAIAQFLKQENAAISHEIAALETHGPFKKN